MSDTDYNHDYVIARMEEAYITGEKATEIAIEYSTNYKLLSEYIELTKIKQKNKKMDNPAGYLIKAVKEGWGLEKVHRVQQQRERAESLRKIYQQESSERDENCKKAVEEFDIRQLARLQLKQLPKAEQTAINDLITVLMYKQNPILKKTPEPILTSMLNIGKQIVLSELFVKNGNTLKGIAEKRLEAITGKL